MKPSGTTRDITSQYPLILDLLRGPGSIEVSRQLMEDATVILAEVSMSRSALMMQHLANQHSKGCEDCLHDDDGCGESERLETYATAILHQVIGFDCTNPEWCCDVALEADDYVTANGYITKRPDQRKGN